MPDSLTQQSWARASSKETFEYTYALKNMSKVPTTLTWKITDAPEVARAFQQKGFQIPLTLKPDQVIEITFSSKNAPRIDFEALDLLASTKPNAAATSLAGADVPALLPKSEGSK